MKPQEQEKPGASITLADQCPTLASAVNYLGDMEEFPVFYSENYQNNNLNLEEHRITVRDARAIRDRLSLERDGFVLVDNASRMRDFRDSGEVERVYQPESRRLITELTGASLAVATGAVLRWGERAVQSGSGETINSRPARFVHVDYSRESFNDFARMHLDTAGVDDPKTWLGKRYVAYNIWRVLTPPPQDVPLGICAANSTAPEDVVTGDAVIDAPGQPEFRFGSSLYRYNPRHRWFWFSDMHPGEALVFKAFDTDRQRLQGCPHSAFNAPDVAEDVTPRASAEIRVYAWFD